MTPHALSSGTNLFEKLGREFTLFDFASLDDAAQQMRHAADERALPLEIVRDPGAEAREFFHATLILVRPDQFVAWASDGLSTDAGEILARTIGEGFSQRA